jgi:tetratricopeptide (TPR) repeat protein
MRLKEVELALVGLMISCVYPLLRSATSFPGNFRSCLTDCAKLLSPPLPEPATSLVRKSFFRSAKALASLGRWEEALDCIDQLLATDQRDQFTDDDEPEKLKKDIQQQIAHRQAERRYKELAEVRRKCLEKALKDTLQVRHFPWINLVNHQTILKQSVSF